MYYRERVGVLQGEGRWCLQAEDRWYYREEVGSATRKR